MTFAQERLVEARTRPELALVRLVAHLRDDLGAWRGLNRGGAEGQVALARAALDNIDVAPIAVHPVAALRALDELLYERDAPHALPPKPQLVEDADAWLVRRPRGWRNRVAESQAGVLPYWLRHHHVVPRTFHGVRIRLKAAPTSAALPEEGATVWAGGFTDGVHPAWNGQSPLGCARLGDPDRRWASVEAALEAARDAEARLVVFPELTIDPDVRGRVADWLHAARHPFALVAAGSFHEDRRNLGHLLGADGRALIVHQKLRPMRTMSGGQDVDEDVEIGTELELLYGPQGLVGLAICLDFCEGGEAPVRELWRAVGPGIVLVPSMGAGSTTRAHERRATELATHHGTTSIVASQHPRDADATGVAWPGDTAPTSPSRCGPVRWGWRAD